MDFTQLRARPAQLGPKSMSAELELFWDATYAIVVALQETHPDLNPEFVGLDELASLVEPLPGFKDDPAMATERILQDIFIAWYEEASQP